MRHLESVRRMIRLSISFISIVLQTAIYGYFWYHNYAADVRWGTGIIYYNKGNVLLIALYAVILLLFSNVYGGLKIGYLKNAEVLFSQIFATLCTNVVTFAQIGLLAYGFTNINIIPFSNDRNRNCVH